MDLRTTMNVSEYTTKELQRYLGSMSSDLNSVIRQEILQREIRDWRRRTAATIVAGMWARPEGPDLDQTISNDLSAQMATNALRMADEFLVVSSRQLDLED